MAWGDIDFGLIVPGMITRGPAGVLFSDYLNEFRLAADERRYAQHGLLNPVNEFLSGEIRTTGDFADNFRALIGAYNLLWFHETWYTVGVMTDPLNPATYIITDATIEAAIGEEAWDILQNYASMSLQDVFKASILQAFYIIYQNTQYYGDLGITPTVDIDGGVTTPRVVKLQTTEWQTTAAVVGDPGDSYSTVFNDWYNDWNTPVTITLDRIRTRFLGFGATFQEQIGIEDDIWGVGDVSTYQDGGKLVIKQTTLADVVVESNIVTTGRVNRNLLSNQDEAEPIEDEAFNIAYADTSSGPFDDIITPNSLTVDPADGTILEYSFWGSEGAEKPLPVTPKYSSSGRDSHNNQDYDVFIVDDDQYFIGLNLDGLEYKI